MTTPIIPALEALAEALTPLGDHDNEGDGGAGSWYRCIVCGHNVGDGRWAEKIHGDKCPLPAARAALDRLRGLVDQFDAMRDTILLGIEGLDNDQTNDVLGVVDEHDIREILEGP